MDVNKLMNKFLLLPFVVIALLMTSCMGDEPLNSECDIEAASVHVDDPLSIFRDANDTLQVIGNSEIYYFYTYESDSIVFKVLWNAKISTLPLTLKVTEGAKIFIAEGDSWKAFQNGSELDFSAEKVQRFRIVSEDGAWSRCYRIWVVNDTPPNFRTMTLSFTFDDNFYLSNTSKTENDKGVYYIWKETDSINVNELFAGDTWKCGNPGFKLSKSSAKPLEYPTVPVYGGGPDGTNCVKLETMDTGAFGRMVNMRIASGSLFDGNFDVSNALKDALKATQFGLPFKHKPVKFSVWLKCEIASPFLDRDGNTIEGVIDEPDAYVVVYRNQDENGNKVMLDGNDVLTSKYIVGMARLPHHYYYEEEDGRTIRRDQLHNEAIHGVTSEWQQFDMDIEYTEELDTELLANNGYSMIIGFASSWQGAYFKGAVGNKLWIDNISISCEY